MSSKADCEPLNAMYSHVYDELRRLAGAVLRHERGRADCSATTLVNEAWIRLSGRPEVANTSPLHFRRIAGRAMRQILVDAARRRRAAVHGGGLLRVTFEPDLQRFSQPLDGDVLALNAALDALEEIAPRQAQLVEARFFGGLTCAECGELLGISEATVMREWRVARAWLSQTLRPATAEGSTSLAVHA